MIIQEPHPTLRAIAQEVSQEYIGTPELVAILSQMKEALRAQEDGVAIAAPQIGVSKRIFVVSKKALEGLEEDLVFINPILVSLGRKKELMSEGCLSVRWKYGMVKRATTATIRALSEKGNEFVVKGKGLLAQIFQHEIDHLDGILFIDTAKDIEDIPPENLPREKY